MAIKVKTARVDVKNVQGIPAAVRVVASKQFVADAMDIRQMGKDTLRYLKNIFPKSPATYPSRGRLSLVEGWALFAHPEHLSAGNPGFTVRRESDDARDHEIIGALDQGSAAYVRIIPKGVKTSFIKTNESTRRGTIGSAVFVTGTGVLFQYKARNGLHFIEKTKDFVRGRIVEARQVYLQKAKERMRNV